MNTIIQNLMNFLNPDAYITSNTLVNALSFAIVSIFYTVSLVRSFEKIVLFSNPTTKIKTKSWLYFAGICLLLLITFFPVYNILRTIMNPELIKRLIN